MMDLNIGTTFTFKCAWGCIVQVTDTVPQPHTCASSGLILDALKEGTWTGSESWAQLGQRIADGLAPLVRELKRDAWKAGARATADAIADQIEAEAESDAVILAPRHPRRGGNLMNRFTTEPMTTMENRLYVDGVIRGKQRASIVARSFGSTAPEGPKP